MQVNFQEALEINGQQIPQTSLTHRAHQHALSGHPTRANFGEMILQSLANQSLSEKQRLYIAEMLEEQLEIELNTEKHIHIRMAP